MYRRIGCMYIAFRTVCLYEGTVPASRSAAQTKTSEERAKGVFRANTCLEAYEMIQSGECGAFSDVMMNCFKMAKSELFMDVETEKRT